MNRVLFKQLFQAEAIDYCQLDWARLASLNEIIAVYLMAQKFGVPVCPHAGGVGLCELVQHLSVFDFMALSGSLENRVVEYSTTFTGTSSIRAASTTATTCCRRSPATAPR